MHLVVKAFRTIFVEGRFTYLFATIIVVVMRLLLFINKGMPETSLQNDNYLWFLISDLLSNLQVSFTASTISIFIIAWVISIINNRFGIIRARTNLPFIIPIFLLSLHPYFLIMSGDYVAVVFILFAFIPLLESYQKPDSYLYSFRSSILIATASLFNFYAITIIPLLWRGEKVMRGPQLRSLLSSLFGLLLVYVSVFSVFFMIDDLPRFLMPFNSLLDISLPNIPDYTIFEWVFVAFVLLFFVINMVFSIKTYGRDKVLTLNFMQFIVFLIVFLLLLQVLYWNQTLFFLTLSVTLISFLIAYFNTKTTSRNHIYFAYIMIFFMMIIYLAHLFPQISYLY
ncbi:MAG TPA: hypothetical protein VKX35_00945 [Fermentimonas sp.]|nr:hypothetical protein [Fermentimonas sp.]